MRYLSIYRPESGQEGGMPSPEHMAAMGRLIEEWTAKGKLISTEPLTPRDQCARVLLVTEAAGRECEPRQRGLAHVLGSAHAETRALPFQGLPEVWPEADRGLMHPAVTHTTDSVRDIGRREQGHTRSAMCPRPACLTLRSW